MIQPYVGTQILRCYEKQVAVACPTLLTSINKEKGKKGKKKIIML